MSNPDFDALRHSVSELNGQISAEINRRKTADFLNWQNQFAGKAIGQSRSQGLHSFQIVAIYVILGILALYVAVVAVLSPGIAALCLVGYAPSGLMSRWLPPALIDLLLWGGFAALHAKAYPHERNHIKQGFVFYLVLCGIVSGVYLIGWFSGAAFPKAHWTMFFD